MPVAGSPARVLTIGAHTGSLIRRLLRRRWRLLLLLPLLRSKVALVLLLFLLLQLHGQLQVACGVWTRVCTGEDSAQRMHLMRGHRYGLAPTSTHTPAALSLLLQLHCQWPIAL